MARLILKSPYIKSTGGAAGYLRYIATRERVEILPDDRPPTRKQEQLIAKLVKDFPDTKTLYEYASCQAKPTKAVASAFLTLALESNWDALRQSEQYLKYIATRPRAERLGSHGLFGDSDGVSLEKAMKELEQYTGNVWTHILSLKREDAARLGFDNAAAWRNLIRAHRNEIAAAMKIPPADFRWYAAFHDEGEHPHVHMMAWSAKPGQAYLTKEGIRQIKSRLTNDIFRDEMLHLYEQKSASRDELVRQARRAMLELVQAMQGGLCDHPEAERLMQELAVQLGTVKGKKNLRLSSQAAQEAGGRDRGPDGSAPHRAPVLRPVALAPRKGGWLLPRHAPGAAPAVQRKGVPADQKRRHPGSGAAASGPSYLRGPGHGPAG